MNDLSSSDLISQQKDIVAVEADGEIVMLSIEKGAYYSVGETSRAIWEAIAQPCTVASLVDELTERYQIDRGECERDVLAFVADMIEENLVEVQRVSAD